MGKVLQHLYNCRIIVTKYVQLNKSSTDRVIVKMSGCYIRVYIVSRMLKRSKKVNIHVAWYNHDACWMLSSSSFYALASLSHLINIWLTLPLAFFLIIFFYKSIGRLICYRTYGTSLKHIILAEKLLAVFMSHRLIYTRKIKVYIRNLIAIKAKEYGKRNVMAILDHLSFAYRTPFIWQIIAASIGTICHKLTMLAMRASPMRWQRINLCNSSHCGDEGGPYGAS